MKTVGSRAQVWNGNAKKTSGGLTKKDLFKKKGRIQQGADADIVIFDAQTIAANAVYGDPYLKPTGILHVLVAGEAVVQNSMTLEGPVPGQKLLGVISQ